MWFVKEHQSNFQIKHREENNVKETTIEHGPFTSEEEAYLWARNYFEVDEHATDN